MTIVVTRIMIRDILVALTTELKKASGFEVVQTLSEITEGVNDLPALHVYWQSLETDYASTAARSTFGSKVRQTKFVFRLDLYGSPRSDTAEMVDTLVDLVDSIVYILEQQENQPFFGLSGIKDFHWTAEAVQIELNGTDYPATRFEVLVYVF